MQKKVKTFTLFLILALLLNIVASATSVPPNSPDYNVTTRCDPSILFSGVQATCKLTVRGLSGCTITGTLTLYHDTTEIASWPITGTTRVEFSDTCTVTKGLSYTLVAELTVTGESGTDNLREYVTKTCN